MDAQQLELCRQKLYSQTLFIGGRQRRAAASALALEGSTGAVSILAEAIVHSPDEQVRAIALERLSRIDDQSQIDALCAAWATSRKQELATLIERNKWIASSPLNIHILSALKSGSPPMIAKIDADVTSILVSACNESDPIISSHARSWLLGLDDQDAIDTVCQFWEQHRPNVLSDIIEQTGYVASKPDRIRVYSALKSGKLDILKAGDSNFVSPLVAACEEHDLSIAGTAWQCLCDLRDPEAVDYLCEWWVRSRLPILEQAIIQRGYVARYPIVVRFLTALKTNQLDIVGRQAHDVEFLLEVCHDVDLNIVAMARQILTELSEDAREEMCRRVIEYADPLATEITLSAHYLPVEPSRRALFLFLTGQWNEYELFDSEHILFHTAYSEVAEPLKHRIATQAHQEHRIEWVDIIVNADIATLQDEDWNLVLQLLEQHGQYEKIWQIAQIAPPIRSVNFIYCLSKVEWIPQTMQEQAVYIQLQDLLSFCGEELAPTSVTAVGQIDLSQYLVGTFCVDINPKDSANVYGGINLDCILTRSSGSPYIVSINLTPRIVYKTTHELSNRTDGENITEIVPPQASRLEADDLPEEALLELSSSVHNSEDQESPILSTDVPERSGQNSAGWLSSVANPKLLRPLEGFSSWLWSIVFSPDGKLLAGASGADDPVVYIWSYPDGKVLRRLEGHMGGVRTVAFSPDGRLLASGSGDSVIRVWNIIDGSFLATLKGHTDSIWALAFTEDASLLASGSADGTIRLWNLADHTYSTLVGHTGPIYSVILLPDGETLASTGEDGQVRLWNFSDSTLLRTLHIKGDHYPIYSLTVSNDRSMLIGGGRRKILFWNLPDGTAMPSIDDPSYVSDISSRPDNSELVSVSIDTDCTAIIWPLDIVRGVQTRSELDSLKGQVPLRSLGQIIRTPLQTMNENDLIWVTQQLEGTSLSNIDRSWLQFITTLRSI